MDLVRERMKQKGEEDYYERRLGFLLEEKRNPPASVGYYNAAFALGAKMYQERLVYAELSAGLSLMSASAQQLSKLTKDAARKDALESFSFVLDNSVVWHPFGSPSFPWAGLWHCVNSPIDRHSPGSISQ